MSKLIFCDFQLDKSCCPIVVNSPSHWHELSWRTEVKTVRQGNTQLTFGAGFINPVLRERCAVCLFFLFFWILSREDIFKHNSRRPSVYTYPNIVLFYFSNSIMIVWNLKGSHMLCGLWNKWHFSSHYKLHAYQYNLTLPIKFLVMQAHWTCFIMEQSPENILTITW